MSIWQQIYFWLWHDLLGLNESISWYAESVGISHEIMKDILLALIAMVQTIALAWLGYKYNQLKKKLNHK